MTSMRDIYAYIKLYNIFVFIHINSKIFFIFLYIFNCIDAFLCYCPLNIYFKEKYYTLRTYSEKNIIHTLKILQTINFS